MGGEALFGGEESDARGVVREGGLVVLNERGALQKIVHAEAIGKPGRAPRGQDVRRTGDVVAQGHGGEMTEENRTGVLQPGEWLLGIRRGNVEMLGHEQIGQLAGFVHVACDQAGSVLFEAGPCQTTPIQLCQLPIDRGEHLGNQRGMPGDEHAGTGAVFCLRNHVAGDEFGAGGFIGEDDHLAGAGDAVDIDRPVDMPFGERDEQVARADDLVDLRQAFDTIGERGHGLRPAHAVDLGDAQFVTGGQQIGVVTPKIGGRDHNHNLWNARDLSGNGGHQQAGGIGRRTAGDTNPDTFQRQVTLSETHRASSSARCHRASERDVGQANGRLKLDDVGADLPNHLEIGRVGLCVSGLEFGRGDAHRLASQGFSVEFGSVFEQRLKAPGSDIGADPLDHLLRR